MHRRQALLTVSALFLALLAASASAQEAIYLDWDQCGPAGPMLHTAACDANTGEQRLYCAFSLAQPLDQVLGVDVVVDLQHADLAVPPWWRLGVGGCRYLAMHADGGPPDGADCADFWQGLATGDVQSYTVGLPYGSPSQARIRASLAVPSGSPRSLQAGTLYYALRFVISNEKTTGADACDGCALSACLVLNTIVIRRQPGAPGGDVTLDAAAPGGGNIALWQGSDADCQAVPVRRSTWGRVKALYR